MFQQINHSNRLDSVAFFFYCDVLKLKVFRKWRQVIRANIAFNLSFQEEEIIEHNIELNLKYSLQQSAKYLLDHVENKTDEYFNYVIEENNLDMDVNKIVCDSSMDNSDNQTYNNSVQTQKLKEESRIRKEKRLEKGRKQKRATLIDLKRHFEIEKYLNRWGEIYKRKYIRGWKRQIDYQNELANRFFLKKFAPYVLKRWKQFNKYHHTIQKSPKRGGYLEMYLKHKLGNNDDTNGSNVIVTEANDRNGVVNNKSYIIRRKKERIVQKLCKKKKDIYFKHNNNNGNLKIVRSVGVLNDKRKKSRKNNRASSEIVNLYFNKKHSDNISQTTYMSSRIKNRSIQKNVDVLAMSPKPRVTMPPTPSTPPQSNA